MTILVGHTNGTGDDHDHDTSYGSGTAFVIVLLGLLAISMIVATPYFFGEQYYAPLSAQRVVLVRADTPVVQGMPVKPAPTAPTKATPLASPGGTLVAVVEMQATPDLSCLKSV